PRYRQFHCGSSDRRFVYSYLLGIAKTSDTRIARRYTSYHPFLSPVRLVPTPSWRKRVKTKQSVSDGRVARCGNSRLAGSLGCSLVASAIPERRAEPEYYFMTELKVFAQQSKKASARSFV